MKYAIIKSNYPDDRHGRWLETIEIYKTKKLTKERIKSLKSFFKDMFFFEIEELTENEYIKIIEFNPSLKIK